MFRALRFVFEVLNPLVPTVQSLGFGVWGIGWGGMQEQLGTEIDRVSNICTVQPVSYRVHPFNGGQNSCKPG